MEIATVRRQRRTERFSVLHRGWNGSLGEERRLCNTVASAGTTTASAMVAATEDRCAVASVVPEATTAVLQSLFPRSGEAPYWRGSLA